MNIDLNFESAPKAFAFYHGMKRAWVLSRVGDAEMPEESEDLLGYTSRGVVWMGLLNCYCIRHKLNIKGVELDRKSCCINVILTSSR